MPCPNEKPRDFFRVESGSADAAALDAIQEYVRRKLHPKPLTNCTGPTPNQWRVEFDPIIRALHSTGRSVE